MDLSSAPIPQLHDTSGSFLITDLVQTGKRLGEATRLQIGNVCTTSLDGSRMRRAEITLVRDMEYLRIHDTRTGRVVASYPDSTPWFHLCAPHCLLIKPKNGRTRRLIWDAVTSRLHPNRNEAEVKASTALIEHKAAEGKWLRCTEEDIGQDGSTLPKDRKSNSIQTEGDVSCLESVVLNGKIFLLAAYKTGLLAAYTSDLSIANSPMADTMMGEHIRLMRFMDIDRATDGILKSVSNVITTLEGSQLVAVISQLADQNATLRLRVRIIQLSLRPSDPDRPVAIVLLSRDLTIDTSLKDNFDCAIHEKGQIHVWGHKKVQIFDLSQHSDQPYRTMQFENDVTSVLRLDQSSIAVCTTKLFDQINLQFTTSQGKFDWPEPIQQSEITKQFDSKLIEWNQKSRRLLCLYGARIIAISLSGKTPTTIADFIDRGLNQTDLTAQYQLSAYEAHVAKNPGGELDWNEWMPLALTLSDCVKTNNTTEFDSIFSKLLAFISSSAATDQLDQISISPSQQLNNDEKLSFIISSIFEPVHGIPDEGEDLDLKIKILPVKTFRWLVKHGFVTSRNIQHSFQRLAKIKARSIRESAVVKALVEYDASLSYLEFFVTHSSLLTTAEAACVISYALKARIEFAKNNNLAITSGNEMEIDGDGQMPDTMMNQTNGIVNHEQSGLIQVALLRLIGNDHLAIIDALRKQLTVQELFALIEFLRFEMSRQGWFVDVLHETAYNGINEVNETTSITRLAKILGCVLDALGMAPWLNTATSAENENLISWMKLEISAALEAVEEASYMSGILHEVALFTKLLDSTEKSYASRRIEPKTVDDGLVGSNALPTGLKPAGYIDVNVVSGGKAQKMSSRQIGLMKSKMVGAYSRERIDLNDANHRGKRKR